MPKQKYGNQFSTDCCFCHVDGYLKSQRGSETTECFLATVHEHLYESGEGTLMLRGGIKYVLRTGQNSGTPGSSF